LASNYKYLVGFLDYIYTILYSDKKGTEIVAGKNK
jgi:hypothetical protein